MKALRLAIDLKPQHREALVSVGDGVVLYDVAEVPNRLFLSGREADYAEVPCVDCFNDCVEGESLFVVQRKPHLPCGMKLIVHLAQECGYRVHEWFFRPGRAAGGTRFLLRAEGMLAR